MFDAQRPGGGGFGGATTTPANPFGQLSSGPSQAVNPFASAKTNSVASNPFAKAQPTATTITPAAAGSNPFSGQAKPSNPFGAISNAQPSPQPFAAANAPTANASPFSSTPSQSQTNGSSNPPFARPAWPNVSQAIGKRKGNPVGQSEPKFSRNSPDPHVASNRHTPAVRGGRAQHGATRPQQPRAPIRPPTEKDSDLAVKVYAALAKDNIRPPQWPANPGSSAQRKAAENFREAYISYREKARKCLIKANLIDDPDKRRALSDALEFKGICEDMCPDWERITRIIQHDVKREEREEINGESQANIELMVTRHARSSAGQDAPLPMDVRSPGALRRTLNYMIDELIPEDHLLPARHNFLWDRTRAIRKDFIYQEYAMGHDEMKDYIYCLETIARFHVTALHLLTQPDFAGKDFSAQQENEQLEKTLISLMQAYDDCAKQGIECEHEADFRSYYIIVMADNPAWMDVVQSFAARFWNDSDSIRTASILVESLKNVWDMQGPLMPPGTSEMALPIISAFFDIVSSPAISYTMACFAEIHFPKVRRLMLKILREAYWRPKTGPTDLTPAVIQRQLRLDSEEEAIEFAKSQGFTFGFANGHMYAVNNARQALSEDKPPRMFSKSLVERKRGNHTLAEVIYTTFYEEPASTKQASAKNDSLFVDDSSDVQLGTDSPVLKPFDATTSGSGARSPFALPSPAAQEVPPNSTTSSRPSMFPTPHSQAVPTSEKQNFFSTLPPPNTDQASNKTTFASTAGFAEASVKPAVKSFMPNIASASPATASSNLPSGKTITVEAEKSNQAPAPPKPGGFNFSSAQNPPSSTSPSIFDKPTSSALPGAASSATTGFVFPGSGPAESLKPTPLFPTTSEPKPNAPSFVFPPPSTTAPKSAPFTAGTDLSATTITATDGSKRPTQSSTPKQPDLFGPHSTKAPSLQHNETSRMPPKPKKDPMDLLTRWYVCADRGLMEEHLEEWMLESILQGTWNDFEEAELERIRKEEDDKSWAEARKFREYSLGVTYFYRWLDNFRKRRAVKRIQLEKEKAREWNLPENRAKRETAARAIKEKSMRESKKLLVQKTSQPDLNRQHRSSLPTAVEPRPRRDSLEEALLVPPAKKVAARDAAPEMPVSEQPSNSDDPLPGERNLLRFENQRRRKRGLQPLRRYPEAGKTYKEGSKSAMLKALSSGTGRDTMSLSTTSLRNSTFSSSYRSSLGFNGSRVTKTTSRVSDPYWKLKANGLVQMPNGEYLHESLAIPMLEDGRRFPGIGDYGVSGSSRASLSQSDVGSIDIPEFSPPPVAQDEQEAGSGVLTRRRSRVSMSPAAASISRYSQPYQHLRRQSEQRQGSLSLSRERKRGYDHIDDDHDYNDKAAHRQSGAFAEIDSGREGSLSVGGGSFHKRARSGARGVAATSNIVSAAAAVAASPSGAAAADTQSVGSSGDSDFLASIDRLLRDVQDAGRTLS